MSARFILPESFYLQPDVIGVAKELLGKVIVTRIHGVTTSAMIVETEAYAGEGDQASHAAGGRRTRRTEIMYARGGVAYVYLCYGIHHLFNVVTNEADIPHAVLIRGVEPLDGVDVMLKRRNLKTLKRQLSAGPGALSAALGLTTKLTGATLAGPEITIEDRGFRIAAKNIITTTRIGVDYAGSDALLPYRFYIKENTYVSKP